MTRIEYGNLMYCISFKIFADLSNLYSLLVLCSTDRAVKEDMNAIKEKRRLQESIMADEES